MGGLCLIEPSADKEEAFRDFIADWDESGEVKIPWILQRDNIDFGKYVNELWGFKDGIGIPDNFVPHTTYWLFDGDRLVAVANLRHRLTDSLKIAGGNIGYGVCPSQRRKGYATAILRETLREAAKLGLAEVLVTCDAVNTGSIGVILKNGGRLLGDSDWEGKRVNRYSITISRGD